MLLARLLKSFIKIGTLHITDANGRIHTLRGLEPGPEVTMRIHDRRTQWKLLFRPALVLGEAYTDGMLTVDGGDLYPLMDLLNRNIFRAGYDPLSRLQRKMAMPLRPILKWLASNTTKNAERNAVYSYHQLGTEFFRLFLDSNMQYSCGYFPTGKETLEEAQEEKMLHLASKLLLKPGLRVLDIGCGWGYLGVFLASMESVSVHGVTLSEGQHREAERLAQVRGVSARARFSVRDYRKERGQYDRIVSVGMFEHVGIEHYPDFFRQVSDLLTDDGVALIHFISRMEEPGENNPWLNKYIFPGSYTPSLSEVMTAVEKQRLFVADIETWRQHYPPTLAAWRKRLHANWEAVKSRLGERFCRMWDFYLAGAEAAFRRDTFFVYQLQLSKRMDAVPITRDYIEQWKMEHRPAAYNKMRSA